MKMTGLVTLSLALVCAACAPSGPQHGTPIILRSGDWEKAFNEGDLDALTAIYTDDARLMPPNAPAVQGSGAVREAFSEMTAEGMGIDLETTEALVSGDLGYRVGTYTLTAADGSLVDRGKYIETWRQMNGEWRMANDIWNSDMPAAGSGTTMIITHEVEDADRWLAAFQAPINRQELFFQHGIASVRQFQNADDPELTALLLQIGDLEAYEAFMAGPDAEAAKAEDGVKDATLEVFVEVE